jgi:hypothetical protein
MIDGQNANFEKLQEQTRRMLDQSRTLLNSILRSQEGTLNRLKISHHLIQEYDGRDYQADDFGETIAIEPAKPTPAEISEMRRKEISDRVRLLMQRSDELYRNWQYADGDLAFDSNENEKILAQVNQLMSEIDRLQAGH